MTRFDRASLIQGQYGINKVYTYTMTGTDHMQHSIARHTNLATVVFRLQTIQRYKTQETFMTKTTEKCALQNTIN